MRSTTSRCRIVLQLFQIQHHAGGWVRFAADGHFQHVIVAVPVGLLHLPKIRRFSSGENAGLW